MPENQCLLTDVGRCALAELLEAAYRDRQFHNKSQLHSDTGLSRDTLNRILNHPYRPCQRIKLEKLFEKLQEKAELEFYFPSDYWEEVPTSSRVSSPSVSPSISFASSPQVLLESDFNARQDARHEAREVANCLLSLNCRSQKSVVEDWLISDRRASAFVVSTPDPVSQQWSVKVLCQTLMTDMTFDDSIKISIHIPSHGMMYNFDAFGAELETKLRNEKDGQKFDFQWNLGISNRCDQIWQIVRGRSIILVLHGIEELYAEETCRIMKHLLEDFWQPLISQMPNEFLDIHQPWPRLIMLLSESTQGAQHRPFHPVKWEESDRPEQLILLNPIEHIQVREVRQWFAKKAVASLKKRPNQRIEEYLQQAARWSGTIDKTLQQICYSVGCEYEDIHEIATFWNLHAG